MTLISQSDKDDSGDVGIMYKELFSTGLSSFFITLLVTQDTDFNRLIPVYLILFLFN